ncbi:MAG: hypothetical protein QM500_13980 [Methylococcales bacterium]
MSDIKTVSARLDVEIFAHCPNCDYMIDLLNESETNGVMHNDDGGLLRQVWPRNGSHDDFECEEVTCTKCKTEFNVKTLEW